MKRCNDNLMRCVTTQFIFHREWVKSACMHPCSMCVLVIMMDGVLCAQACTIMQHPSPLKKQIVGYNCTRGVQKPQRFHQSYCEHRIFDQWEVLKNAVIWKPHEKRRKFQKTSRKNSGSGTSLRLRKNSRMCYLLCVSSRCFFIFVFSS